MRRKLALALVSLTLVSGCASDATTDATTNTDTGVQVAVAYTQEQAFEACKVIRFDWQWECNAAARNW